MGGYEMKDNLRLLAKQRSDLEVARGVVTHYQEQLEQTEEHQTLQKAMEIASNLRSDIHNIEEAIKSLIYGEFVSSGLENTKPYDGIQIKKFKVVHILDERTAILWAATNAPQVLSLKKAPFNKIAKVLDLEFVEIDDEYRAQIASDLSMYEDKEDG